MIIQCCVCKKKIGEKEPLASTVISHTYCDKCGAEAMRQIDEYKSVSPQVELLATTSMSVFNFKP